MRSLSFLGCLLLIASCHPVSNQVNRLELQCGPSESQRLVKILSATGHELETQDLTVFRRDGESFQTVTATAKGCFAYDTAYDYIIHGPDSQGLAIPRGQDLQLVTLRDVQTSDLFVSCPTQAVTQDFDFGGVFTNPGDQNGFALDIRIRDAGTLMLTQQAALVQPQDYSLRPFRNLRDGLYSLEIRTHNLLKDLHPRPIRCDVQVDNTAPQISLEPGSFLPRESQGFTLIEPTARIRFTLQDNSRSEILSCWVSQKETMLQAQATAECPLKAMGHELSPPEEGYWILVYQAVDEAGQRSPLMQQAFMVYQGGAMREISLEMELTQFLFDNNQNLRGVQKTLAAESRRRQLPTAYEREEAKASVFANLFQMSPRKIPYLEMKYPSVRYISMTPDGTRTIINQVEPNNVLIGLDSMTGKELWRTENFNGRIDRSAFTSDSKRMIASGALSGELLIWSTETGTLLKRIPRPDRPGFESKVFEIYLTSDDRYVGAAGFDDVLYVYDLEADEPKVVASPSYDQYMLSFAWSPRGERFVTTSGKSAFVYTRDGILLDTITRDEGFYLSSAAFLSEDELVISSVEQTDREDRRKFKCGFFYVRLGQPEHIRMATIPGNIDKVLPSPDRKHFFGYGQGSNAGYFFANWRQELENATRAPSEDWKYRSLNPGTTTDGAYWSSDSRLLFTTSGEDSADGYIRVVDGEGALHLEVGPGNRNLYVAEQGHNLVLQTIDQRLEFWHVDRSPIDRMALPQRVQVAKFAPDQSSFLTIEEHEDPKQLTKLLRVWDRGSLRELSRAKSTAIYVNTLMNSMFVSADEVVMPLDQYRIQRLDVTTAATEVLVDRSAADVMEKRGAIISFAVSKDGARLALGYAEGFVEIINIKEGRSLFVEELHQKSPYQLNGDMFGKAVTSIRFRGSSYEVISAGHDGQLMQITPNSDAAYSHQLLFAVPELIYGIDVDEDQLAIAARLDGIILYNLSSGNLVQFSTGSLSVPMLHLNVRQDLVAATTFVGDLFVFKISTGELRQRIRLKRGVLEVRALSISADGQEILTANQGDLLFLPNQPESLYRRFCSYLSAMQICPSPDQPRP
jgi:WD40 repeat protein